MNALNVNASQSLKSQVYEMISAIAGTLGSSARLRIIQLLAQSPKGVEELSHQIGESVANTSQHLQRLARERLVVSEKKGTAKIYRLSHPSILTLWENLQDLAQDLAPELRAAEDQLTDSSLRAASLPKEILRQVSAKDAVLLDVRDPIESASSPIPLALSIPLSELKKRLGEIPKRKWVYVACRGRFCHMATDAVRILRTAGFKSFRLRESPYQLAETRRKL